MNRLVCKLITTTTLLLTTGLLLTACGNDVLYSKLDEQQANEMLALLLRDNIDARKVMLDKNWALKVPREDLPVAVEMLKAHGYPRDNYESLGDIFKKEGFVSSPLEERTRLLHGLSQELSKTISEVDGVIVARVHLAIPEKEVLSQQQKSSSASIFIKHRADSQITEQIGSIKALVVNSVEGLPYDNVTVTLFPSAADESYSNRRVSPLVAGFINSAAFNKVFIAILCSFLVFLVCLWWFKMKNRQSPVLRSVDHKKLGG